MKQLKAKGEVFTVLPDGSVVRYITKFSDIFADIEERLPPLWEEAWNRKLFEDWKRRKRAKREAEERLFRQRMSLAAVLGVVTAVIIFCG